MKKSLILLLLLGLTILVSYNLLMPKTFNGKIEGVFKLNGQYKCDGWDDKENKISLVVKDTKFRATSWSKDGLIIESVGDISDCIYGWVPNTPIGEQVCITKEEFQKGVNILEKSKDTGIIVNCTSFKVNETFETPKGISFVPPPV